MMTLLFASIGLATAQTLTVTGTVVSEKDGQPVAGAYVLVNGTTIGTMTNDKGEFGIAAVPADAKEIIVTFLGMSTAKAPVQAAPLFITMEEDMNYLEDVVVVAYGSAKREAVTGSVTSVKGETLASAPVTSVDKALQVNLPVYRLPHLLASQELHHRSVSAVTLRSMHRMLRFGSLMVFL